MINFLSMVHSRWPMEHPEGVTYIPKLNYLINTRDFHNVGTEVDTSHNLCALSNGYRPSTMDHGPRNILSYPHSSLIHLPSFFATSISLWPSSVINPSLIIFEARSLLGLLHELFVLRGVRYKYQLSSS